MAGDKGLVKSVEGIIERFADAKLYGSLRDGGMFVIGWVVLLSSELPHEPQADILLWIGSVMTTWFGILLGLRGLRSFLEGEER